MTGDSEKRQFGQSKSNIALCVMFYLPVEHFLGSNLEELLIVQILKESGTRW